MGRIAGISSGFSPCGIWLPSRSRGLVRGETFLPEKQAFPKGLAYTFFRILGGPEVKVRQPAYRPSSKPLLGGACTPSRTEPVGARGAERNDRGLNDDDG